MAVSFNERLKNGETLIGTIVSVPSPEVAEVLSLAGFDWLFIDMEHGAIDITAAQRMLQAADALAPCLIRVPSQEEVWIKKCLDMGAAGIIVPHVNSADEARRVLAWAKYPPRGTRSVGIGRAHGYGPRFLDYMNRANEEIAVVLQIEHIEAVKNIDAILQIPGIDALFVGPYDLSGSMGKTGQVNDGEVRAAIAQVRETARKAAIPVGIFVLSPAGALEYVEEGFTLMAVGADTLYLSGAAQSALATIKERKD